MAGRGKGKAKGRSPRGKKAVSVKRVSESDVPELDVSPPPPTMSPPVRSSVRLNSSSLNAAPEESLDVSDNEVEAVEPMETEEAPAEQSNGDPEGNGEQDDAAEIANDKNGDAGDDEKVDGVEDAEMVSEDEDFEEAKEPLDTEAVSDDELKEESQGLPETEAVSDDELPEEKRRKAKVAEAEAVSEDELPDDESKAKKAAVAVEGGEVAEEPKKEGKRKLADGEYDPCSPTSENSGDGTPAPKKVAVGDTSPSPKTPAPKAHPELEKYWKTVIDDPSDFTGWTYLLQYVDQENDMEIARDAYDSFLAHYPYCYGYWRKYADLEKRKGNTDECEKVFDRGLKAIPLSVDLWLHYLNYIKAAHPEDKEVVRAQFERALQACGLEFRSDRLWESYIKWEKEKKDLITITALYDRLLAVPTQGYTTHFDTFQDHVNGNPPQTILPVDDFLDLRREVVQELKQSDKTIVSSVPGEEAPPGEEVADKEEDSGASVTARMEEETSALREKILSSRRKVHKLTVAAVAARWNYEEGIKRPYFHVKPLERCQLKNWKEYLDYEIEQGDHERIMTLFERCLIACALYEEFWTRFIRYLETVPDNQTEKIRDVYERACLIHHKKKPNLHLQWAVFEESAGCYDKAASILSNVETTTPNMLQVAYRRINLERRRGLYENTAKLYEEYIAANKSKAVVTNMTVKYARFTWKLMGDVDKAIEILEKALEKDKDNTRLYLQLIDMGLQKSPVDEERIVSILDQFLDKEGDLEQKIMFAQRKIEFLEDFGTSIEKVQKAQDDFQKYVKQVKEKKKKSEFEPPVPHSSAPSKKSKSDSSSSQQVAGPPMPNVPPPSSAPPTNYPPTGYPPNYYGQYPPPTADQNSSYPNNYATGAAAAGGYNNYQNWNNYQQGNYGNYGQSGWPGYYPNY